MHEPGAGERSARSQGDDDDPSTGGRGAAACQQCGDGERGGADGAGHAGAELQCTRIARDDVGAEVTGEDDRLQTQHDQLTRGQQCGAPREHGGGAGAQRIGRGARVARHHQQRESHPAQCDRQRHQDGAAEQAIEEIGEALHGRLYLLEGGSMRKRKTLSVTWPSAARTL